MHYSFDGHGAHKYVAIGICIELRQVLDLEEEAPCIVCFQWLEMSGLIEGIQVHISYVVV